MKSVEGEFDFPVLGEPCYCESSSESTGPIRRHSDESTSCIMSKRGSIGLYDGRDQSNEWYIPPDVRTHTRAAEKKLIYSRLCFDRLQQVQVRVASSRILGAIIQRLQ